MYECLRSISPIFLLKSTHDIRRKAKQTSQQKHHTRPLKNIIRLKPRHEQTHVIPDLVRQRERDDEVEQ